MKIKNLILVPLLGAALVATCACSSNGSTSSSSDSGSATSTSGQEGKIVARIIVKQKADSVIDEVINLDDYVDVRYDDGSTSKDYTLEVQASSLDLVSVDGHKVTFVGEGTVNINIKAGGQSAKFSTVVYSKLKKSLTDAVNKIAMNFAFWEYGEDDEGAYIVPHATHNDSYTTFDWWDGSYDNPIPGGFLKTQKGNTYAYTLDENYENINVDPSPYGTFENYYVNMPLNVNPSLWESKTKEVEGEQIDYLYLDRSVPSSYSSFSSWLEEFYYCVLATQYNSSYRCHSMEIYLEQFDESRERFMFVGYVQEIKSKKVELASIDFLIYEDDDEYGVDAVKEYIDAGLEPAGVDTSAIQSKFAAMNDAKNFTLNAEFYDIVRTADDEPISSEKVYDEQVLVNNNMYQDVIRDSSDNSLLAGEGFVEHEGSLYSYTYDEETNPATLIGAGKTIYADALEYTLVALAQAKYMDDFFASSVESTENGDIYTLSAGRNNDFLKAFLGLLYSGTPVLKWLEYALENYGEDLFTDSYVKAQILVANNGDLSLYFEIFSGVNEDKNYTYYAIIANFTDIGTTDAIATEVTYPYLIAAVKFSLGGVDCHIIAAFDKNVHNIPKLLADRRFSR